MVNVNMSAPKLNMKAAPKPMSLIIPNMKLFTPRNTPASKLGTIKNCLENSSSMVLLSMKVSLSSKY